MPRVRQATGNGLRLVANAVPGVGGPGSLYRQEEGGAWEARAGPFL